MSHPACSDLHSRRSLHTRRDALHLAKQFDSCDPDFPVYCAHWLGSKELADMCNASLRGIMWRAASAAVGSVGLAVCMHIAPASYSDAATDDASSLALTIVERGVPAAVACVFHESASGNRPDGFLACAERVLHATRALASDNDSGRQVADARFDNPAP